MIGIEKEGIRMKKKVKYAVAAVLLVVGVLLSEIVMQFGTVFFLVAAGLIWWLGRYALRKDRNVVLRAGAMVLAVVLLLFVLWAFNEIYGNPITKNVAKSEVQAYLEESYPGKSMYIESVSHNMSAGSYEAWIAGEDGGFYVSWRDGQILYDTFGER